MISPVSMATAAWLTTLLAAVSLAVLISLCALVWCLSSLVSVCLCFFTFTQRSSLIHSLYLDTAQWTKSTLDEWKNAWVNTVSVATGGCLTCSSQRCDFCFPKPLICTSWVCIFKYIQSVKASNIHASPQKSKVTLNDDLSITFFSRTSETE